MISSIIFNFLFICKLSVYLNSVAVGKSHATNIYISNELSILIKVKQDSYNFDTSFIQDTYMQIGDSGKCTDSAGNIIEKDDAKTKGEFTIVSSNVRSWPECEISCSCNSNCIGYVGQKLGDGTAKCDTLLSTDKNAGSLDVQLQSNSESEYVCFKKGREILR